MRSDEHEGMVEHHTKYKEIHGVDETVWLSVSDHRRLHNRLRRDGECSVPSSELNKISKKAYCRTDKGREYHREYQGKLNRSTAWHEYARQYSSKNIQAHEFLERMERGLRHRERISYNNKTGNIKVWCGFEYA